MTNELTLRDIAQAVLNKHAVSGRQLDVKARKAGLALSYTTVNAMASGAYASKPGRATLDALVKLSDFTEEEVYTAAGRPVPLRPFADELPDGVDALRPGQRNAVLAVVRQFVKDNNEREAVVADADSAASNTQAPDGADKKPMKRARARTLPKAGAPGKRSPDGKGRGRP